MAGRALQSTIEIAGTLSPSLEQAIRQAVDRLEEMSEETLESAGAAARLADEISTQESVLRNLQRGYADFIVSGRESSDEAQQLAERIQDLSDELEGNRGTLEAAERAARGLTDAQDDTADAYDQLKRKISEQESELATLRRAYANVALEQGDTSEEAQRLANEIDQLSGELNENRQRLSNAEDAADRLGDSLNDAEDAARQADDGFTVFKATLANLAADAIGAAIDGLKELAGNIVELGQNFTGTMSEVQAISGASGDELETLEACAREFGATTTFSATEAAEALKYMALAGWDVDQSTSALGGVLDLAAASGMELGAASDMVTDYLSAFGMKADQAAYFADLLASAQASSNTSAEALGEAYKNCAANLNAAGQDVETVTSLLEGMANQGYKGSEAGTAMAAIMRDITNAMDKGKIKIGDTLVAVMDAEGNFRDLTDILTEVEAATNGMGDAERAMALSSTFTADSTKGLNLILNEGMDNIAGYEESLRGASGAAGEMAATMNDNLTGDLAQMNSAWEELGLKIYDKFEEPLRSAVQFVTSSVIPGIEWLLGHLPEVGIALGTVGAIIAALNWGTIVGKLSKVSGAFSGLMSALGKIPGPALAIAAVIAALAAGFAYLWETNEDFRDNVLAVWEELKGSFSELGGTISGMIDQLMPLISQIASTVLTAFGQIATAVLPVLIQIISEILPVIIDLINKLLPVLTTIIESVLTVLVDVINQLLPLVMQIIEAVLPVLLQLVQTLLPIITQIVDAVLPVLIQLINAILPIITQIISAVLPVLVEILNALTPILDLVISLLQPILNLIISLVEPILNLIISAVTPLIEIFATLISTILEPIMPILSAVANVITSVLGAAIQAIQPIIESLTSVFQGLIDFITGVFSGNWSQAWNGIVQVFGGLWDSLVGIVKAPINAVIGLINKAIGALNNVSVTIPDWVPVVGGNTFGINIPTIPMLAAGGFTDGVSIAGEAGMEAVISFDKRYHAENVAIWEKAGQMLGTLGGSAGEGEGLTNTAGKLLTLDDFSLGSLANDASTVIYYDFSGFTWSPQIQTGDTGDDTDDFMAQLRAHEAEFFDWLEEFIQAREVAAYA